MKSKPYTVHTRVDSTAIETGSIAYTTAWQSHLQPDPIPTANFQVEFHQPWSNLQWSYHIQPPHSHLRLESRVLNSSKIDDTNDIALL